MLVVGDNLKDLCVQHQLIDDLKSFDVNSLTLHLHNRIKTISTQATIDYGKPLNTDWVNEMDIPNEGVEVNRAKPILACSRERVSIPAGYFGLIQTKGSLARLFVTVQCNDGQIEYGFKGRITLEIVNLGNLRVRLAPGAAVAQLFIFRTSTNNVTPYSGRYQDPDEPTVYRP